MSAFRVTFSKDILGLHFPVASINVRHARSLERALRAAEIKFTRLYGEDWRVRADAVAVEPGEPTPPS
jgi:hypothetical protein